MGRLTRARNMAIEAAEAMIDQANKDFDAVALPLGREINKVRKAVEATAPKPEPKQRAARQVKVLAGMDEDEQEYFQQLKKKAKR